MGQTVCLIALIVAHFLKQQQSRLGQDSIRRLQQMACFFVVKYLGTNSKVAMTGVLCEICYLLVQLGLRVCVEWLQA